MTGTRKGLIALKCFLGLVTIMTSLHPPAAAAQGNEDIQDHPTKTHGTGAVSVLIEPVRLYNSHPSVEFRIDEKATRPAEGKFTWSCEKKPADGADPTWETSNPKNPTMTVDLPGTYKVRVEYRVDGHKPVVDVTNEFHLVKVCIEESGKDVAGTKQRIYAGRVLTFHAYVVPRGLPVPVNSPKWSIPGKALRVWTVSEQRSHTDPLIVIPGLRRLRFWWPRGAHRHTVHCEFKITDGPVFRAETTYNVICPEAKLLTHREGTTGLYPDNSRMGYLPGKSFYARLKINDYGAVQWTQSVTHLLVRRKEKKYGWLRAEVSHDCDNRYPVGQDFWWEDYSGAILPQNDSLEAFEVVEFALEAVFMYRHLGPQGKYKWVPLAGIDWGWKGKVERPMSGGEAEWRGSGFDQWFMYSKRSQYPSWDSIYKNTQRLSWKRKR